MKFEIPAVDLVAGTITYGEVTEELTLTALVNIIIAFVNALIKYDF